MKCFVNPLARVCFLLALLGVLPAARAAQLTNSWTGLITGERWDSGSLWSLTVTPSTNQALVTITNGFGALSPIIKTVQVDNVTVSNAPTSMTISNLLISAPLTSNGSLAVQGLNTLSLTNLGPTPLVILDTLTLSTGGAISISNSNLRVNGLGVFVAVYNDGDILLNGGSFLVTNEIMELGNVAQGTLEVSNGTTEIGALEIGENPGSAGTLTVAGGTNTLDGYLFVGYAGGSTGAVWVTNGRLQNTNAITRVGNDGVGQMTVSNGTWLARDVIVGFTTGVQGTLTIAGGTVAMVGPFNIAGGPNSSPGGTGTVYVTGGGLAVTNVPANVTSASGEFIVDGTVVLTNGGLLVATNSSTFIGNAGRGILTNFGGVLNLRDLSVGTLAGSEGTMTVAGGTNLLSSSLMVGANSAGASGTVWVTGGQLIVTNGTTCVGSNGVGQMTISDGQWLAGDLTIGYSNSAQGTLTVAGGTTLLSAGLSVGFSANATGTVWLTGGQLIKTNLIGYMTVIGFSGIGQMTVSNGTWFAQGGPVEVGYGGGSHGTLTIAGGTNTLTDSGYGLYIGDAPGATGAVWMTGGQLITTNGLTWIADNGVGQMTVSNGMWLASTVILGGNVGVQGRLTLAGGTILSSNLIVGADAGSTGVVTVTGGQLTITNASTSIGDAGIGQITVSNGTVLLRDVTAALHPTASGTLTVAGGTVTASLFAMTNSRAALILNSGTINSGGAAISNITQFADGNGIDAATYHLLGGVHSFAKGLRVRNNAVLSGCGTINGNVLVDAGGTIVADCGGSLTFDGSVTNNGTMQAINGSVLESYGTVVNNGLIDITGGTTNFHGTFVNNGSIVGGPVPAFQITSILQQSNNVFISWQTSIGATNALQETAGGPDGSYNTNAFTDIFIVTNTVATSTNYVDVGGATNKPARYYRVRLVP